MCLGSKVESLALPGSSITEASLLDLLPCLTSLRRLDLRGLDSLFMSGAFLSREEHRQQVIRGDRLSARTPRLCIEDAVGKSLVLRESIIIRAKFKLHLS